MLEARLNSVFMDTIAFCKAALTPKSCGIKAQRLLPLGISQFRLRMTLPTCSPISMEPQPIMERKDI